MRYYDAHNHLHDHRLDSCREDAITELLSRGLTGAVVNGTREEDWGAVATLAAEYSWIVPSFGLHPWFVENRTDGWLDELKRRLDGQSHAVVGEIGLDRWIQGYDIAKQIEVFTAQLRLATMRNLPVTIHCLKAWGALWEIIRSAELPARGFLLHAYGGPAEMARGFVERGAYFSFSTYFLHERKAAQRELFRSLPPERILVETDAPDMAPPPERSTHRLTDPESGKPLNHPSNLLAAYEELAQVREGEPAALAAQVEENFRRLFLWSDL
ncbi:TatD family hydrolase [Verrucomicrobiota bacterium sgz303538]